MTTTMTTTDISTDIIMNLSSFVESNTLLPYSPELQLSIQDLVQPTETAETLLETLSTEQLNIIEQTVSRIKERKLGGKDTITLLPGYNIENQTLATITKEQQQIAVENKSMIIETIKSRPQLQETITNNFTYSKDNIINVTQERHEPEKSAKPPATNTTASCLKNHTTSTTHNQQSPFLSSQEPTTEIKEGVEWVTFVYSHHRTLRRYCIRIDLDKVDINTLDEKFKKENCVYPRANLSRETYCGNRWSYETECNVLGWKLAYLNFEEIAGKRGLIQRAVDSYRNRYPGMRSRRVARQEKLLKGTLRKRKNCDSSEEELTIQQLSAPKQIKTSHNGTTHVEKIPKTILIEDVGSSAKCRIRINIESVLLDAVDITFRKNNCVFPRSINVTAETPLVSQRRLDEAKCNELGWKLAWLNPRQLANKKNLLQRALDTFRNQFVPELRPRRYASRVASPPLQLQQQSKEHTSPSPLSIVSVNAEIKQKSKETEPLMNEQSSVNNDDDSIEERLVQQLLVNTTVIPLTVQALTEQQKEFNDSRVPKGSGESCYSGTTVTLDFHDYCFSPPPENEILFGDEEEETTTTTTMQSTAVNSPENYLYADTTSRFDDLILDLATTPHDTTAIHHGLTNLNEIYQQVLLNHDLFDAQQNTAILFLADNNSDVDVPVGNISQDLIKLENISASMNSYSHYKGFNASANSASSTLVSTTGSDNSALLDQLLI